MMGPIKCPVTVLMISLNEAHTIERAIDSVREWVMEIILLDSGSTDGTIERALANGVKLFQRRFTNFGDHWNSFLRNVSINTPWTFVLAPDETVSPELKESIAVACTDSACPYIGFEVVRRLWFMGKPLHVRQWETRLFRTGHGRMTDVSVNEHIIIDGARGRLNGHIEHYDSPNLFHWWEKQNRYTSMEALGMVTGAALAVEPRLLGSALQRRMFLKNWFFRIPLRYSILWFYNVFYHGVWRDGSEGLAWAHLRSEVFRMRQYKAAEMRRLGRPQELPKPEPPTFDPRIPSIE